MWTGCSWRRRCLVSCRRPGCWAVALGLTSFPRPMSPMPTSSGPTSALSSRLAHPLGSRRVRIAHAHPLWWQSLLQKLLGVSASSFVSEHPRSVLPDCVMLRTVACQAPLSMEILRARLRSGLPRPPLRDLTNPGIQPIQGSNPHLLWLLCWQADFFTTEPSGKPSLLW